MKEARFSLQSAVEKTKIYKEHTYSKQPAISSSRYVTAEYSQPHISLLSPTKGKITQRNLKKNHREKRKILSVLDFLPLTILPNALLILKFFSTTPHITFLYEWSKKIYYFKWS